MKIIKFYPFSEKTILFTPEPSPASRFVPAWYRKQPGTINDEVALPNGFSTTTIKKCMPIFDAMTAGYILSTPCDIFLDATDPEKLIYSVPPDMKQFQSDMFASHAPEQYLELPIDTSTYHKTLFRIMPFWSVKTAKGYSSLFTQPYYKEDSPLFAMAGLVDTDTFISEGHLSFLVEKNFKGIIKQGTPLVQVIPIKRESWIKEIVSVDESKIEIGKQRMVLRSVFANAYKNIFRSKKDYR